MGLFEDELKRAQQQRAMYDAEDVQRAQQAGGADLGTTLAGIASRTSANDNKGFLSGIVSGIGEKINDIGSTLSNMGKTVIGGITEQSRKNKTTNIMNQDSDRRNEIAKKYGYNSYSDALNDENASQDFWNEIKNSTENTQSQLSQKTEEDKNSIGNVRDVDLNQAKGQALSTIGTVLDFAPGGGIVGNVLSGAVEGVGDAYKSAAGGGQIDLNEALARSAAGSLSALAGGAVANKLGAGKTILGQAGKSALSGATSGAISGGIMAGANDQDILSGALEGAKMGAAGGAVMGGASAVSRKALGAVANKIQGNTPEETTQRTKAQQDPIDAEATGWGNKDMTNAAKKRNKLQKFGDTLKETGQATTDSEVYSKLKGNTADEMARKNSVQRLRDIGFEPSDYKQAADLSEVANKWYSDQVAKSDVALDMPDTLTLAKEVADARNLSPEATEKFMKKVNDQLNGARIVDNDMSMAKFKAADLEKIASDLGDDAHKLVTTSHGGSKAANGTLSADDAKYADALNDVKKALRSKVDDMVDFDADSLKNTLKAAGASDAQINYLADGGSMAALKRNTSLLEDARTMQNQIKSDALKRGANATNSTNIVTQLANASGAGGLLNTAVSPFRSIVGNTEKAVGSVIGSLGDRIAGQQTASNGLGSRLAAINRISDSALNGTPINNYLSSANNLTNIGNRLEARNIAQNSQNDAQNAEFSNQASEAINNAINQYGTGVLNYADVGGNLNNRQTTTLASLLSSYPTTDTTTALLGYDNTATQQTVSPVAQQLSDQLQTISNGMSAALAAGDITSYAKLAELYETAYGLYSSQVDSSGANTSSTSSLNATQQNNLAKLQSAESAIDELEALYDQAGGGQGRIGGTIAEIGGNLGLNSNVSSYNTMARGLINQIAAAVGKTDSLNTEGEVQRALDLVPKITDTAEEAKIKLASLRSMLASNKQTYNEMYGVSQ